MTKLTITKIDNLNTIVIKQSEGRSFFISTPEAIVISIPSLAFILKFLLENKFMSRKILEGILEEINE